MVSVRTRRLHYSLYGNPALSNDVDNLDASTSMLNESIPGQESPAEDQLEGEDIDIEEGIMFSDSGVYSEYRIIDFFRRRARFRISWQPR